MKKLVMYSQSVLLLILVVLVTMILGCTPALEWYEIQDLASTVNKQDGVDKVEAVLLAQNFIISQGLADRVTSLEPHAVNFRKVWIKDGEEIIFAIPPDDRTDITIERIWLVYFKYRKLTALAVPLAPFRVVVNAETGSIGRWGIDKLGPRDDVPRTRTFTPTRSVQPKERILFE